MKIPLVKECISLLLRALESGMMVCGAGIMTLGCILISNVVYTVIASVIPIITKFGSPWYWFFLISFGYLSFCVLFNYLMAMGTHPGNCEDDKICELTIQEAELRYHEAVNRRKAEGLSLHQRGMPPVNDGRGPQAKLCSSCQKPKPPRAHHCFLCGECVLKMDHHCPWINGCVGFFNQRYFVNFIIYLWCGTLYAALLMGHMCYNRGTLSTHDAAEVKRYDQVCKNNRIFFTSLLVCVIWVAMFVFMIWNGLAVFTNQTSIEFQINRSEKQWYKKNGWGLYRNPYDLGRWQNILQVYDGNHWNLTIPHARDFLRCICLRPELQNNQYPTESDALALISPRRGGLLSIAWLLAPTLQRHRTDGVNYEKVLPMRVEAL